MISKKHLLFIDDSLIDENLQIYLSTYQLNIIHQKNLFSIADEIGNPYAIVIHYSFFKSQLHSIQQLYTNNRPPLIVINEEFNEKFCIYALESGADDFLVKPLHPPQFYARINAINRRMKHGEQKIEREKRVLIFADWKLFLASRQLVNKNNQEIYLSSGEYELLCAFVQQPQQVLGREFLSNLTKKNSFAPLDRGIDVQISRLRQKIELDAKKPNLIKTVRNRGYLFAPEVRVDNI